MNQPKLLPPANQRRFGNPWAELAYLCRKIRFWLYTRKDRPNAKRYRARLRRVLRGLPKSDEAIVLQEGLALLSELDGEIGQAILHRRREIALTELLHKDIATHQYSAATKACMLKERDAVALLARRSILETLEKTKRTGVATGRYG